MCFIQVNRQWQIWEQHNTHISCLAGEKQKDNNYYSVTILCKHNSNQTLAGAKSRTTCQTIWRKEFNTNTTSSWTLPGRSHHLQQMGGALREADQAKEMPVERWASIHLPAYLMGEQLWLLCCPSDEFPHITKLEKEMEEKIEQTQ